jgi:hypothetical protein
VVLKKTKKLMMFSETQGTQIPAKDGAKERPDLKLNLEMLKNHEVMKLLSKSKSAA